MNQSIEKLIDARIQKHEAHRILSYSVTSGKTIRPTACSRCGKPGIIQAHHEDYSKPLEIIWLCAKCHGVVHKIKNAILKA